VTRTRAVGLAIVMLALLGSVGLWLRNRATPPTEPAVTLTTVFRCHELMIGTSKVACLEDVIGPGTLLIEFVPDPPHGSWTVAVNGLKPLAEVCEFEGSFDQKRLSALQGRGKATLRCPVAADIDRPYHELAFVQDDPAPNSSLGVTVSMVR
jgi:hypothetical protein